MSTNRQQLGQPPAPAPVPASGANALATFLPGVGDFAGALYHFFAGDSDDAESEEQEQRPRRFKRFGSSSARAGTGSCCRR